MSPRRRESEPGPTATAEVADQLRVQILDGEFPPGAPLREEELAERHQVSRHTVRAALAALTAERLLSTVPYRGSRVVSLTDAELDALQELRGALESEAVRQLRRCHGDHWPKAVMEPIQVQLEQLQQAERGGDWPQIVRAHSAVHQGVVAAAESPRITEAYAQLDSEIRLLLSQIRPDYPAGSLTEEHRRYLSDVQKSGPAAVREHLAHSTALIRANR